MAPKRGGGGSSSYSSSSSSSSGSYVATEAQIPVEYVLGSGNRTGAAVLYAEIALNAIWAISFLVLLCLARSRARKLKKSGNATAAGKPHPLSRWFTWFQIALLLAFVNYTLATSEGILLIFNAPVFVSYKLEPTFRGAFTYLVEIIFISLVFSVLFRRQKGYRRLNVNGSGQEKTVFGLQRLPNMVAIGVLVLIVIAYTVMNFVVDASNIKSFNRVGSFYYDTTEGIYLVQVALVKVVVSLDILIFIIALYYTGFSIVLCILMAKKGLPKKILILMATVVTPALFLPKLFWIIMDIHVALYNLSITVLGDFESGWTKMRSVPVNYTLISAIILGLGQTVVGVGLLLVSKVAPDEWGIQGSEGMTTAGPVTGIDALPPVYHHQSGSGPGENKVPYQQEFAAAPLPQLAQSPQSPVQGGYYQPPSTIQSPQQGGYYQPPPPPPTQSPVPPQNSFNFVPPLHESLPPQGYQPYQQYQQPMYQHQPPQN